MAGKRGRPRKDATKINVALSDDERDGLKDIMIEALNGGRIGDIEPLTPTAFANLMMFALGEVRDKHDGKQDGPEFEV